MLHTKLVSNLSDVGKSVELTLRVSRSICKRISCSMAPDSNLLFSRPNKLTDFFAWLMIGVTHTIAAPFDMLFFTTQIYCQGTLNQGTYPIKLLSPWFKKSKLKHLNFAFFPKAYMTAFNNQLTKSNLGF